MGCPPYNGPQFETFKGVGYIEFYDAMAVPMAISLSGQPLLGQPVVVKPSEAEKNLVQSNVDVVEPGGSVGPYSGGARRLYVGNLHFNITEEKLRQFIYEPFPVESNLCEQIHDHIIAEIVSGSIFHKEVLEWMKFEFFILCHMLLILSYCGLEDTESKTLNSYLSRLVQNTFEDLEDTGCIKMNDDSVEPLMLGSMAPRYYLGYMTVSMFGSSYD